MRLEYVVVGLVLMMIILAVAITMLGGAGEGLKFVADLFSTKA